jgi:predicted transposase YdaD
MMPFWNYKRKLFRILLEKGFRKERIVDLIFFLNNYVSFKGEKARKLFAEEINHELKIRPSMGIQELIRNEMLRQAKAEGQALGEAKKEFEMVAQLLKKGFSVDQIHEIHELPMAFIMKVKKKWEEDGSNDNP